MSEQEYSKKARKRFVFGLLLAVCSLGLLIWRTVISPMTIRTSFLLSMMVDLIGIMLLAVGQAGCMVEKSTEPEVRDSFSRLLLVVGVAWILDMATWAVDGNPSRGYVTANYILNSLYYLANIFTIDRFSRYLVSAALLRGKAVRLLLKAMKLWICMMVLLIIVNLFVPVLFSVTAGIYRRESLTGVVFFVDALLLLLLTVYSISASRIDRITRIALITYVSLPFAGVLLQMFIYGYSFVTLASVISVFILYVHLYVHQGYVMEEQRQELLKKQTAVMLSQIQPHFLFNSLSTIIALCDLDPKLAKKTAEDFSTYLEHNLKAVTDSELIPFTAELEQIQAYLRIERARFGDLLKVEYDLKAADFRLPSLTVQPLVENAVKHGLHEKPQGGTVSISTREEEEEWVIEIRDDGVGFDATRGNKKGFGVGIENVRKRLQLMCKGKMEICSDREKGTQVEIRIPKEL